MMTWAHETLPLLSRGGGRVSPWLRLVKRDKHTLAVFLTSAVTFILTLTLNRYYYHSSSLSSSSSHRSRQSEWALPINHPRYYTHSRLRSAAHGEPSKTNFDDAFASPGQRCGINGLRLWDTSNNPLIWFTAEFHHSTKSSLFRWTVCTLYSSRTLELDSLLLTSFFTF